MNFMMLTYDKGVSAANYETADDFTSNRLQLDVNE